ERRGSGAPARRSQGRARAVLRAHSARFRPRARARAPRRRGARRPPRAGRGGARSSLPDRAATEERGDRGAGTHRPTGAVSMARKQDYKVTTRLVHGPEHSSKWDFTHHVTPPLSSSTTYRLDSAQRGARGFAEFGRLVRDTGEPPVYIYDRLDEPTRSILEGELAELEQGESCVTFASGMAAISGALGSTLRSGDELVAHPVI